MVEVTAAKLVLTTEARFGSRRLSLNPDDYRPSRIELLDDKGFVVASSDLSKYESVAIRGARPETVHPWIATDLRIVAESGKTQAHIEISSPEITPDRPRPSEFDLQHLLEVCDVKDVRLLDADKK